MGGRGSGRRRGAAPAPRQCHCGAFIDYNRGGARGLCATHYQAERRAAGADVAFTLKRMRAQQRTVRREHAARARADRRNALRAWRAAFAPRTSVWVHAQLEDHVAETPSTVAALTHRPCARCGCPPTFGLCPVCAPSAAGREPGPVAAAPIVQGTPERPLQRLPRPVPVWGARTVDGIRQTNLGGIWTVVPVSR